MAIRCGPYLQVKVAKIVKLSSGRVCPAGHGMQPGKFCGQCTSEVIPSPPEMVYPRLFDILPAGDYDILSDITPAQLLDEGTLIFVANSGPDVSSWLYINGPDYEQQVFVKQFPTDVEVALMKSELEQGYGPIIEVLRQADCVENVSIGAGYVPEKEY